MGRPKALVIDECGSWLERATTLLLDAGCSPVFVVLGAAASEAVHLLPGDDRVIPLLAHDWETGMSESLRVGLARATATDAPAVVVTLVDLPGLPLAALTRITASPQTLTVLRQAHWDGVPGHPVLIGRAHWPSLLTGLTGDSGARRYLTLNRAEATECGDLGDGRDVDDGPTGATREITD